MPLRSLLAQKTNQLNDGLLTHLRLRTSGVLGCSSLQDALSCDIWAFLLPAPAVLRLKLPVLDLQVALLAFRVLVQPATKLG